MFFWFITKCVLGFIIVLKRQYLLSSSKNLVSHHSAFSGIFPFWIVNLIIELLFKCQYDLDISHLYKEQSWPSHRSEPSPLSGPCSVSPPVTWSRSSSPGSGWARRWSCCSRRFSLRHISLSQLLSRLSSYRPWCPCTAPSCSPRCPCPPTYGKPLWSSGAGSYQHSPGKTLGISWLNLKVNW